MSCKKEKIQDITIGTTLVENQSYSDNRALSNLIVQTLDGNNESLKKLIYFDCGSGSGCYDLGYIIKQIVDKLGEATFNNMIIDFSPDDLIYLKELIRVGMMYNHQNSGCSNFDKCYPKISETIKAKI